MKQKEPIPPPLIRFFIPSHGDNALKLIFNGLSTIAKSKNTC